MKPSARNRNLIEPFTEADFHVALAPVSHQARLLSGAVVNSHWAIRTNLNAFSIAAQAVEIIDLLLPLGAPSPEVFDILQHLLRRLTGGQNPLASKIIFVIHLFRHLGHGDWTPSLWRALSTDERQKMADQNEDGDRVWDLVSETSQIRCERLIEGKLREILPRPLKSVAVFEKV